MLDSFAVPPSPLQHHPGLSYTHYTLVMVHVKATSKPVTHAWVLRFGDDVFQGKFVTGELEGHEERKN